MTQEELKEILEGDEIQDTCPVYELFKMAKEKKHIIKPDEWQTPPSPRPEMI